MKCKKCGGYVEFPETFCDRCGTRIHWKAWQITLAVAWKILVPAAVAFIVALLVNKP